MSREDFDPDRQNGLPDELKKEVSSGLRMSDSQLLDLLKDGGGTLNISEVLIGLWKKHRKIKTRHYVVQAMRHLRKRGLVYRTGRKGEYTLNKPTTEGEG